MKIVITIFCLFFVSNSNADTPQNLIDFMNQYQGSYHHPTFVDSEGNFKDDQNGVIDLIKQVTAEINSGSTDPRIYWLRPTFKRILLQIRRKHHKDTFVELYGTNDNHGPEYIKLVNQETIDYEKALQLNINASIEEKLNEDMVSKIYINRALPAHILEMASRENMAFMEKRNTFENERGVYQQFYFDMINSYVRDKDYDNALRILKEFDGVQSGVFENNIASLDDHKAKWEHEAIEKSITEEQEKTTQPTEPKKPDSVVTAPKQQPVVKEGKTLQKEEVLPESNNNEIYIISIVLAVLLLIGFVVVKRKKK